MSKCPDCKKLHVLKRELCDTCYVKQLEATLIIKNETLRLSLKNESDLEAQLEATEKNEEILAEHNKIMMKQLDAVRKVIPILEDAGDYCDCGCGTHHAELVKAALNGEDDE